MIVLTVQFGTQPENDFFLQNYNNRFKQSLGVNRLSRDLIRWIPRYMVLTVHCTRTCWLFSALPNMAFVFSIQVRTGPRYPWIVARSGSFAVDWFFFTPSRELFTPMGSYREAVKSLKFLLRSLLRIKESCLECHTLTWQETSVFNVITEDQACSGGTVSYLHPLQCCDRDSTP